MESSLAVIAFLDGLKAQIIEVKVLPESSITTVNECSQLLVVPPIPFNGLNIRYFHTIMYPVQATSAIKTQENTHVDTHMTRVGIA